MARPTDQVAIQRHTHTVRERGKCPEDVTVSKSTIYQHLCDFPFIYLNIV